jgi:dienelactone hydrolase
VTNRSIALAALLMAISSSTAGAQTSTRAAFLKVIDRPRVPLAPQVTAIPGTDRFVREHFTFASEAGERVPGLTLKRNDAAGRRPAVIVLHGTGDAKEGMIPLLGALAGRGFLAVAIDGRHHGQRAASSGGYDAAILQAYRTGRTHPLFYDTVWDAMRLIDYLQTRADLDPTRIGMMGISKGGIETYLTAAVDPRVSVAVPVIAAQSFKWALEHDAWQSRVGTFQSAIAGAAREDGVRLDAAFVSRFYERVVPGIAGQFAGPSMLPLIAPRPLLIINGDSDALTPLPGVRMCATAAEQAFKANAAPERFRFLIQSNAGHELTAEGEATALNWFVRWLKP